MGAESSLFQIMEGGEYRIVCSECRHRSFVSRSKTKPPNVRAQFGVIASVSAALYFYGGGNVTDTIQNRLLYLGNPVPGLGGGQLFSSLNADISNMAVGIGRNATSFNGSGVGADA